MIPPWTTDPVLQKGRFLNVYREDDRGTRALIKFVEPVAEEVEQLVQALFFARWCNKDATLDGSAKALADPDAARGGARRNGAVVQPHRRAGTVGAVHFEGEEWSRRAACALPARRADPGQPDQRRRRRVARSTRRPRHLLRGERPRAGSV